MPAIDKNLNFPAGAPLLEYFINMVRGQGGDPNKELCLDGITVEDLDYRRYPDRYYVINNINMNIFIILVSQGQGEPCKYICINGQKFDWTDETNGVIIHRNGRVVWFENYDNKEERYRFVCGNGEIIDRQL